MVRIVDRRIVAAVVTTYREDDHEWTAIVLSEDAEPITLAGLARLAATVLAQANEVVQADAAPPEPAGAAAETV